jgi:hypothetical protein
MRTSLHDSRIATSTATSTKNWIKRVDFKHLKCKGGRRLVGSAPFHHPEAH